MIYKPEIPESQLEIYRAVAKAYRSARRRGGRQQKRHWAAVREVILRRPEMSHREADRYAGHAGTFENPSEEIFLLLAKAVALQYPVVKNWRYEPV